MRNDQLTVFVIDDDASVRDSLALMLGLSGYRTALFADAEAFLHRVGEADIGACIVDLRLPGMNGLELQAALQKRGIALPVIIITAHGDVPAARRAFHADAIDFLEKPFPPAQLMAAIERAFGVEKQRVLRAESRQAKENKLRTLTEREREVLKRIGHGLHAKEIAATLGISPRTVEVHKAHIMAKLNVRNAVELVRYTLDASPDTE